MRRYRSAAWQHILHHVVPTLLLNGVAPYVVFSLLRPHTSQLHALMVAALVPLAEGIVTLARQRRINVFGTIVFVSLTLSIIVVLLGGSPRVFLIRESALSGSFGLAMLVSLLCPRPLVYYLAGHFVAPLAPARLQVVRHKMTSPWFHSFLRLLTAVWGLVTVADAALNTFLAFHLPVATFLAVTPIARYGMMGCTFAWTLAYAHRGRYLAYLFGP